ncbi:polysaccharide deacetylase family protein [Herbinix luporum]|uniref:NodB homology domain-containing protein n=1 Tax=Herbinix luporum TaxID=1679721 RepID=A0A0K8J772_9FIRM|nr:polysaccharide deacetylase family protein [Herbinix luporum]MDI9488115.1 polysaccharide deacetylase family protein [Bacillota bacterium]CUH93501.1 hypothetical protein SD1D_1963 [Herbinix luporum]HHT56385.1 polysaccharide deacetylase [Herbinix luporum]
MNKFIYFIILIFFGLFLVYALSNDDKNKISKDELSLEKKYDDSIMLMAKLENNLEAQKHLHVHSEASKDGDYTTLFPELYAVYNPPKKNLKEKKTAYLTFDDGPSSNTFEILDILNENNIPATFFIVGSAITKEGEEALRRMANEGHTIGIHTYSHICDKIYCSVERFLEDYNTVYQQIYEITGIRANIYRFPWGSNNGYSKGMKDVLLDEMKRRGFACYDWNVDSNDSVGRPTAYSIRRNVEKDLENYDHPIILMHDSGINRLTVETLPEIIDLIKDKGYDFGTLDNREPYIFEW